jgi:hypothetical protein
MQVPIIGGSGAQYRGVSCPLQRGQVPIIGGAGAHYRGQVPVTEGSLTASTHQTLRADEPSSPVRASVWPFTLTVSQYVR